MLEEYVDGIELNGILVVRDGEPSLITLSDRLRPPGLGFGVGWIHQYPSSLDDAVLERCATSRSMPSARSACATGSRSRS